MTRLGGSPMCRMRRWTTSGAFPALIVRTRSTPKGDRTALNTTTYAANPCTDTTPGDSTATAASYSYDSNSRQLSGANGSGTYFYDAFGRQTTIPGADSPDGGGNITLSYFDTDAVRSIAQTTGVVTDTTTHTLDPDGRRLTSTDVNGSTTTTTTNHKGWGTLLRRIL